MVGRKSIAERLSYIILILIVAFIVIPYIWTFITSLKDTHELYSTTVTYLPKDPTLDNYIELFTTTDFFPAMGRSLVIAFLTAFIAVIVSSLAAYGFARYSFRGRHVILNGILLLYMFASSYLVGGVTAGGVKQ